MEVAELAELLRDRGYRATGPRLRVYEALRTSDVHVTADELADLLDDAVEPVPLSSVYRALAVLDELGLVRATRLSDEDVSHWELAHPDEHFHVVCRGCGAVEHHRGSLVSLIEDHLRAGHGFVPEEVTVLVRGLCTACAASGVHRVEEPGR